MVKSVDLTGQKIHRLTVIKRAESYTNPNGTKSSQWLCQCDCGNQTIVRAASLINGTTHSCGCLQRERAAANLKRYNDYEIQEDYVIMYTSKGEFFLVDLEDFWRVKDICWSIDENGYVCGHYKKKKIRLHRFLLGCPKGMEVDHIGGKKTRFDCRKDNLRLATDEENNWNKGISKRNKSGTVGVCWVKRISKWMARISVNKKDILLGYFENIEDAITARKQAEKEQYGEFSFDKSQEIYNKNVRNLI